MSDCIFCKIVNKDLPSGIIFENDDMIAFHDINPKAPVHVLLVPKKHIVSIAEMDQTDIDLVGEIIYRAKLIAEENGIGQSGYKVIANTGDDGGQLVSHLHFHLLGGEKLSGLV